jgi:hypothetical protein
LALELGELKPSTLKLLVFIGNVPPYEAKTGRRFPFWSRSGLISKVALYERPQLLVVYENHVFAYASKPPLEHYLYQSIVFFVSRSGSLCEWESGDDRLRVVVCKGIAELLELHI